MADIFQEEYSCAEYTEVEDLVFLHYSTKENDSTHNTEQESQEENAGEDDSNDSVEFIVESAEPAEQQRIAPSLEELANSDFIHNRQLAARKILDFLSEAKSNKDELHNVIFFMAKLSDDEEPMVRSELMEQIPSIASYCREHSADLECVIRQQLVPITVKLITDNQIQVRKVGQAFLLVLLERKLIDNSQLTEWICPLISQLATSSTYSEDFRSEAVNIMCKMAPLVGVDITIKFFLEPFASLCSDESLVIRKMCLLNFGDFCRVIGSESTEATLLPKFLALCTDEKFSIQKACVEALVDVAGVVTRASRQVLANYYIGFLDNSQWQIEITAQQFLGGFITTFADPDKTGLHYNYEDKTWTSVEQEFNTNQANGPFEESKEYEIEICDQLSTEDQNSTLSPENTQVDNETVGTETSQIVFKPNYTSKKHKIYFHVNSDNCLEKENSDASSREEENCNLECSLDDSPPTNIPRGRLEIKPLEDEINEDRTTTNNAHFSDVETISPKIVHCQTTSDIIPLDSADSIPNKISNVSESEPSLAVASKDGHIHLHLDNENVFNNFQFWRTPLPELEVDIDIGKDKTTNIHVRAKVHDDKSNSICASDLKVNIASPCEENKSADGVANVEVGDQEPVSSIALQPGLLRMQVQSACTNSISPIISEQQSISPQNESSYSDKNSRKFIVLRRDSRKYRQYSSDSISSESHSTITIYDQDIVPPQLLQRYLNMIDSVQKSSATNANVELSNYCAFSLPGVAYTLGRKYWPYLKGICLYLASDMQWRIRKTVASYLHELAVIIGPDYTANDLVPLFFALLKDLDEVRLALLLHLSDFLKHLKPLERSLFLPQVEEFLKMDNERNWRFRYTLAQQMIPTTSLYRPSDVCKYLFPIASWLIRDRISEVRHQAILLMAVIVKHLADNERLLLAQQLIADMNQKFLEAQKWLWRQTYVILCEKLAMNRSLPTDIYVDKVLPNLLSLAYDTVPNVRLAVSRCVSRTLIPMGYLLNIQENDNWELVSKVMFSLRNDNDKDVQYFAQLTTEDFYGLSDKISPV